MLILKVCVGNGRAYAYVPLKEWKCYEGRREREEHCGAWGRHRHTYCRRIEVVQGFGVRSKLSITELYVYQG